MIWGIPHSSYVAVLSFLPMPSEHRVCWACHLMRPTLLQVALGRDFTLMMSGDPVGEQSPTTGLSRAPTVKEKRHRRGLQDFLQSPITGQRKRERSLLLAGRKQQPDAASPSATQETGELTPRRTSRGSIYMEQL